MQKLGNHAVVLGAGMAGLMAARVLRDHFRRVTVIERDALPALGASRKGVPQDRHAHALLARGCTLLEGFFPGFMADMALLGARRADVLGDGNFVLDGQRLPRTRSGIESVLCGRALLEGHLRQRLLEEGGVSVRARCEASGLFGDFACIRGVRLRDLDHDLGEEFLEAALVVDATGRGTRFPSWLSAMGHRAAEEERVEVDIGYVSATYRTQRGMLREGLGQVTSVRPPCRRSGVALAIDGERVIVTLAGYLREHPITDHGAMREFARGLPAGDIAEFLSGAEPLSPPVAFKFPHSRRARYERRRGYPAGAIAFGDSLCSFNPVYGQGMTVAAMQAELLGKLLTRMHGDEAFDLPASWYREVASLLDGPWAMSTGADLRFAEVAGPRPLIGALMNRYFARLTRAASADAATATALVRVLQLVDPPSALLRPSMLARALRHGGQRRSRLLLPRSGPIGSASKKLTISGVR